MIAKELLAAVVKDQRGEFGGMPRMVGRELAGRMTGAVSSAVVLKGVRRCGKSTLLRQLVMRRYGEEFYYVNFDDERLIGFEARDFQQLMETFASMQGKAKAILLDEVQNIGGWELFVNRLMREGYAVFITGSNANLLSKELGTHLTGRHIDYELYPFSFREFLEMHGVKEDADSTKGRGALSAAFREYLHGGGMPEPVISKNPALLGQIVEDIIQKDIIKRYGIRKIDELRSVLAFLIRNAANRITINSISENFRLKSPVTVQKYLNCAEETYLLFTLRKFERKTKLFDKNPRKVYCVDNGIVARYSPGIETHHGAMLENTVAVELRRRGGKFYYYLNKNGTETDFVTMGAGAVVGEILQVCLEMSDIETEKREENALLQTLKELKMKEGTIITLDSQKEKKIGGKIIRYAPAWKWMLEGGRHE